MHGLIWSGRRQEISFSVLEIIFKFFSAGTYKGSKRFREGKFFPIEGAGQEGDREGREEGFGGSVSPSVSVS